MVNQFNNPIISRLPPLIPDHLGITNSLCMVKVTEHHNLEVLILVTVVAFQEAGVSQFRGMVLLKAIGLLTQVHPLKVITLQDD